MRALSTLVLLAVICVVTPFAAAAANYVPDATAELYWSGFGGPECYPFPPEAVASYTIEVSPAGAFSWTVLADSLPHNGVGVEHTFPIAAELAGYDYLITCFVELDGLTFSETCAVEDVRIFTVCPGPCGARDVVE